MSDTLYIEKRDIGGTLSNWIYCGLWMMFAAEKLGLRSYIHWPSDPKRSLAYYQDLWQFKKVPNMYDWYFDQPVFDTAPPREQVWTWEEPCEAQNKTMSEPGLYDTVSQVQAYYRKNLKFNAVVRARGDAIIAKYAIDFPNTMGIMWRGTESIHDGRPRMTIETYFPFIDDVLAKEPHLRLMCTAEEETILDPLLKRYPTAFQPTEFFMSPYKAQARGSNPEHFAALTGYEKGMQPAVMMYLFSKCAHLIKNRSTVSSIASWLSTGRIVCLAHPENLGHGFDLSKAEINGELVPLNR